MTTTRPSDQPSVAELVETAAEAIRTANHRTITPGLLTLPEIYRVLADLSALAHRLGQLGDQLIWNNRHRFDAGGLRLDESGRRRYASPAEAVADLNAALAEAAALAPEMGAAIDRAHNASSVLADNGPLPGGRRR